MKITGKVLRKIIAEAIEEALPPPPPPPKKDALYMTIDQMRDWLTAVKNLTVSVRKEWISQEQTKKMHQGSVQVLDSYFTTLSSNLEEAASLLEESIADPATKKSFLASINACIETVTSLEKSAKQVMFKLNTQVNARLKKGLLKFALNKIKTQIESSYNNLPKNSSMTFR